VGLPVGDTLKGIIASKLDMREGGSWDEFGDRHLIQALVDKARGGSYGANMRRFSQAAQSLKNAMPQAISIDNYLHTHSNDADIVMLGKMGIAASILEAEFDSQIKKNSHGYDIDFLNLPDSWHNTFCKMLTENVKRDGLDNLFENVTFITFNYDRCIEHYLVMWLKSYMRISYEEACELCKRLTIFHPYGQVGKLPWQAEDGVGVPFGAPLDQYNIANTASQIRTFTERVDDDPILNPMRRVIQGASRLVYLGFSFGLMNMELMQMDTPGTYKTVMATTLGMSESNKQEISQRLKRSFTVKDKETSSHIDLLNISANQLLKDYWYTLST